MKERIKRAASKTFDKFARYAALTAVFCESRRRNPAIQPPRFVPHSEWKNYLSNKFNAPGVKVLELGSRSVPSRNLRRFFDKADYIGFDFYPGPNVDISGDAHKLSQYFNPEEFDLVFSSAVFEHLAMPWIVAEEIAKILKVGGYAFVETHFSFSSHERPWNFFQFSDMGLKALFNPALGFSIIDSGMSNPLSGWFSCQSDEYLRYREVGELYCHSEILCQKTSQSSPVDWRSIDMDVVTGETAYPEAKGW